MTIPTDPATSPLDPAAQPTEGALVPTRPMSLMERMIPARSDRRAMWASVAWMCLPGMGGVLLGIHAFGAYGWPMFVYLPFMMGCGSALLYSAHRQRTAGECLKVGALSVVALGALLLIAAIEGAICIALASPLGLLVALGGSMAGYQVQRRAWGARRARGALLLTTILLAPTFMGAESAVLMEPEPRQVTTWALRPGTPAQVWRSLTQDRVLPPHPMRTPLDWLFVAGIGYPVQVQWQGQGVGAKRLGSYTTGRFAQEVTAWEPEQRLAFKTLEHPAPMRELTPWGHFDAPHLHGYLVVERGELRLTPGPADAQGRPQTRVEATSVYLHHIWPAGYWHLWSDALMRRVHERWLNGQ